MVDINSWNAVMNSRLPQWLSVDRMLQILSALARAQPLILRDSEQRRLPHQRPQTAWMSFAKSIINDAFRPELWPLSTHSWGEDIHQPSAETRDNFVNDMARICQYLEIDDPGHTLLPSGIPNAPHILISSTTHCRFCTNDNGEHVLLYGHEQKLVTAYGPDFSVSKAYLTVASCPRCKSFYYPDAIHKLPTENDRQNDRARNQRDRILIYPAEWYPVSRHGVWVHRNIAHMLYCAIKHMKTSWAKFTTFFNETFFQGKEESGLTPDQSYHLFVEYFGRILLDRHGELDNFCCLSNTTPSDMVKKMLDILGKDGGCSPGGKEHNCNDCMHPKQYADPVHDVNNNQAGFLVAGINDNINEVFHPSCLILSCV
jgi:hypothetical protein